MNLLNVLGFLYDLSLVIAVVLSARKFERLLSKIFLTLFGLSAIYYLTLIVGGQGVRQAILRFQNGTITYLGILWIIVTVILSAAITFQWLVESIANRRGWDESLRKKRFPIIWLFGLLVFFIFFFLYSLQIQNEMGSVTGNPMNIRNSGFAPSTNQGN